MRLYRVELTVWLYAEDEHHAVYTVNGPLLELPLVAHLGDVIARPETFRDDDDASRETAARSDESPLSDS